MKINTNEYDRDGKRYIKEIRRCAVVKKCDNMYILLCRITERGKNEYFYRAGQPYIDKSGKLFWLDEKAMKTVSDTVRAFDNDVSDIKANFTRVPLDKIHATVWYRRLSRNMYRFLAEMTDSFGITLQLTDVGTLEELLGSACSFRRDDENLFLTSPKRETIDDFPFYRAAVQTNDRLMQIHIKHYYNIAVEKELSWFAKMLGVRILPTLPEEYDKEYAVDADTVDYSTLSHSGYRGLHRPYFAMKGSTHDRITINPHTKSFVDAAKIDMPSIAFKDYLELFDHIIGEETNDGKQD